MCRKSRNYILFRSLFHSSLLISTAYLVLYVAMKSNNAVNYTRYGDFSYGLYIYAWPIQQAAGMFFGFKAEMFPIFMATSFVATLICAILSYHLIERPALRLKNRGRRFSEYEIRT